MMSKQSQLENNFFGVVTKLFPAVILLAGMGLRCLNLTNPPLDFHAWRQLRGASIARSIFYQYTSNADPAIRQKAQHLGLVFENLEPKIFEHIVGFTYLIFDREVLWIARVYAILFWTVGGFTLFKLAHQMTSLAGALLTLAFYMVLPYGVVASRSFQPDPFMIMWVCLSVWGLYRWKNTQAWSWAILVGVFSGLAVLVKVFAVFPIAAAAVTVVLQMHSLKQAVRNKQVWSVAVIMFFIPAAFYLFSRGNAGTEYLKSWVVAYSGLLFSPGFYIRWITSLRQIADITTIAFALAGVLLLDRSNRPFVIALWVGYFLFGLSVPSLIITHDYYNLMIIPLIAISLAPLGDLLFTRVASSGSRWQLILLGIGLGSVFYLAWIARNTLVSNDYHQEILGWQKMGQELPDDATFIGITHDYNARLNYYGLTEVSPWPLALDQTVMHELSGGNSDMSNPVWEQIFLEKTAGFDYFIITDFTELDQQPVLEKILSQYDSVQGEGYILYDLRSKN